MVNTSRRAALIMISLTLMFVLGCAVNFSFIYKMLQMRPQNGTINVNDRICFCFFFFFFLLKSLIDALLAETPRPAPATPSPRHQQRGGAGGMGQLWVKLDELKRENDDLKRQRARSAEEHAGSPKSPKSQAQVSLVLEWSV